MGARITGSGRADLVKLRLGNSADVDEMGVTSTNDDSKDLEGTASHLIEKGRKDILQILLDYGAEVNQKNCAGKTVMSRMEANEILSSIGGRTGGNGVDYIWPGLGSNYH